MRANFHLLVLAVLVALIASAVSQAVKEPLIAQKEVEPSADFQPKAILKTGDLVQKAFAHLQQQQKEQNQADENVNMIDLKPAQAVEEEPIKIVDPMPPQSIDAGGIRLPPILPMMGGLSPFLKSIFSPTNNDIMVRDDETSVNEPMSEMLMPKRPHGIMTIVLIKASKSKQNGAKQTSSSDDKEASKALDQIRPNINALLRKILPQSWSQMFGGANDLADREHELFGPNDMLVNRHHQLLGGGDHDIDRIRFEQPNQQLIGAEEHLINNSPFKFDADQMNSLANDHHRRPQPKKCMMMSFMRLKASAYYRTIVHLLFFSGIVLLFLFMIILTIRVYKRRRALRYYNNSLHVATISNDDLPPKKSGNSNTFLFRIGNLRNSYAQKQAEAANNVSDSISNTTNLSSSLLFHSPPAYDNVISNSTRLTRQNSSLARAFKKDAEEDSKSTTSLPAYSDALTTKSSEI